MPYLDRLCSLLSHLGPRQRSVSREQRRRDDLRNFAMGLGREDFERRHPDARFAPIVVLLASYLEADNIGAVLKGIPEEACGHDISVLVVVDGGDDGTEKIVTEMGAFCAAFPVNLGHGVALRLGYQLAADKGASYVVTMDADGQDDPSSVPDLVAPLVAGTSDFVIASRRLGTDESTDPVRRAGTVFFATIINALTHQHLTDTSMGLRALRVEVLNDVILEQDQYQTAELIISAASRGWRLSDVPTVRHARTSGESKKGHNALFALQYSRVIMKTWLRELARR
jgi:Glycosyl transferase family 2